VLRIIEAVARQESWRLIMLRVALRHSFIALIQSKAYNRICKFGVVAGLVVALLQPHAPTIVNASPATLAMRNAATLTNTLAMENSQVVLAWTPTTSADDPGSVESATSNTANTINAAGTVSVTSVWTADIHSISLSAFNPSDGIFYYGSINNATGITQTAHFNWYVDGPCGLIAYWDGNLQTRTGIAYWYLERSIPTGGGCAGTYSYRLSVTYNGVTTSQRTWFKIHWMSYVPSLRRGW
jgi:hypothetical protein